MRHQADGLTLVVPLYPPDQGGAGKCPSRLPRIHAMQLQHSKPPHAMHAALAHMHQGTQRPGSSKHQRGGTTHRLRLDHLVAVAALQAGDGPAALPHAAGLVGIAALGRRQHSAGTRGGAAVGGGGGRLAAAAAATGVGCMPWL